MPVKTENTYMDKDKNYNVGTCDHTEEIAKAMYEKYYIMLPAADDVPPTKWSRLDETHRNAWRHVAKDSLKIIGNHAAEDIKEYAKDKFKQSSGWLKALWGALFGGVALAGYLLMNSCTGVDSLILQGEKGQVCYYVTDTGERVLVVNPAKVNPEKK